MIRSKSSELALRYDGKPLAAVSCPIVVHSIPHPRPVFAFIDKTWLSKKRYEESGRRKQQWRNTYNTVQKMNDLAFDPYYASALIAMAQDARSSISDRDIQVTLLLANLSYVEERSNIPRYTCSPPRPIENP
jgi:hypothetical protein